MKGLVLHPAEGTKFSCQQSAYGDKSKPFPDSHSKLHGDNIKFSIKNGPLYQGSLLRRGMKQRLRDYPGCEVGTSPFGRFLACKVSDKSNRRILRYYTFIFSLFCSIASVTSYLTLSGPGGA